MRNTAFHPHYGRLEKSLKRIALRLRLLDAFEFFLRLASIFLAILLGSLSLDKAQEVFPYIPFIYYALGSSALLFVLLLGIWRTAFRPSMGSVARAVEKRVPRLKDNVTNSLLLFNEFNGQSKSDQFSKGLVTAHIRKTADEVTGIHPNQVVTFRRAMPQVKLFLALFVVFTVVLALDPPLLGRSVASILDPFSLLPARETFLSIDPAPTPVLRGTPVAIRAKARGAIPDRLSLSLWPEKREPIRVDMESEGNGDFIYRVVSAQTSFRYQAFSGKTHSSSHEVRVVDAPDIGKMRLTLIPPSYTRLPREVKEDGHIAALKGTVVNLEAEATKPVTEGKLILNQRDQLPLEVEGEQLKGNLLVFYPGTYSLSIRDDLGFENANPVRYRIHVIPDQYPEVELISPGEDQEVSGDEVLPVLYAARDDFGLTRIRLLYEKSGRERSVSLRNPENRTAEGPVSFKWDLASLALTPGDRVTYRVEVWDNDSLSGPKAGHSKTLALRMRDLKGRAAEEAQRAQEVADALLDLLADHLEELKDRKALSDEIARVMEKVRKHLDRLGTEKIERFNLESLNRNLATLHRRIEELPEETITQEMERLALLAEDLAKNARMHEVEALAREIRNRHQQLVDALQESKGTLAQEQLQALLKELEKLKDLISRVMEALSRMAGQLPDEFMNSPDLSGLDFQNLFKDLEEIQQKLMAGDTAGALEAAQRLLEGLSQMMAAMARAGARASMGSMDRLQSEVFRQANELEKILAKQKEILAGTESVDGALNRLIEEETEKRFNQALGQLEGAMEKLHRLLPSEQRDSVLELERLLKEKRIRQFSEFAGSLSKDPGLSPDAKELVDTLTSLATKLAPGQRDVMTPENKARFPDLASQEKELQDKTEGLGEKLEVLSQLFPGMDTEIINDLKDGAASMGRATGKLDGEDASGAIPPEEEAIRSLTRSQQAMQQMARQMAMGMQANRWAYPWGYDPRAGWYYGPPIGMPTLPQPGVERFRERGYTGIDREEFDPPSRDAYQAPKILREKVMEAMKEEIPSQYRRGVERYFRGLTE